MQQQRSPTGSMLVPPPSTGVETASSGQSAPVIVPGLPENYVPTPAPGSGAAALFVPMTRCLSPTRSPGSQLASQGCHTARAPALSTQAKTMFEASAGPVMVPIVGQPPAKTVDVPDVKDKPEKQAEKQTSKNRVLHL